MISTLRTTATGGSPLVVALSLFCLFLTAVLSLAVAGLVIRGYRRNRDGARLWLALGLILLATGPIVVQLLLTNLTGISAVGRSAAANASKLLGLGAMMYAIYGATRPRPPRERTEKAGLSLFPLAAANAETLALGFSGITGIVGSFVASVAYRGYRRNESRPMLYLALGIVLLTAVPAAVNVLLTASTGATDAEILLSLTVPHLCGVVSILYALTRA
ncbi:hypothetical protein [Haladaptatus sp. CMAA 1911]|uniref:DUF7521 family protein n=1 Tax=unclassified Haladaptatus TaxID=2622732 RepID=UPI003754DB10